MEARRRRAVSASTYNWVFVCLFAGNAKTTARIDAKRSAITKNNPESVLCGLKSPVLVFSERYRDISGIPSWQTAIFTYLPSTSGSCFSPINTPLFTIQVSTNAFNPLNTEKCA